MQRRVRSHAPNNSYSKRVVVGNTAGTVAPAWRAAAQAGQTSNINNESDGRRREMQHHQSQSAGSKAILSQLPPDVTDGEVEHLFTTTVGPVYECYLAHNSQGRSKGVAIVHFQRPGDALEARRKYNGKIIDGRRPLKIELIVDPPPGNLSKPAVRKEKTLAERLSGAPTSSGNAIAGAPSAPSASSAGQPPSPPPSPLRRAVNPRRLTARVKARNIKRGPRRPNKSAMELDREMESYMADRKPIKPATTRS